MVDRTIIFAPLVENSALAGREDALRFLVEIGLHDLDTLIHLFSTTAIARAIANELRLDEEEASLAIAGALFHDIGKLDVPTTILRAPRTPTDEEWAILRAHPTASYARLMEVGYRDLADVVLHHHERLDGSGYPSSLRGTQIPLATQILSVADVYDTMHFRRAYKAPRPTADVLEELHSLAAIHFDREIIDALTLAVENAGEGLERLGHIRNVTGRPADRDIADAS